MERERVRLHLPRSWDWSTLRSHSRIWGVEHRWIEKPKNSDKGVVYQRHLELVAAILWKWMKWRTQKGPNFLVHGSVWIWGTPKNNELMMMVPFQFCILGSRSHFQTISVELFSKAVSHPFISHPASSCFEVIQYHGERLKWRRQINVEKAQRTDRCLGLKVAVMGIRGSTAPTVADARAFYGWFCEMGIRLPMMGFS